MVLEFLVAAVGINGIFFGFAAVLRTDKVTDLSYSLTFLVLAVWGILRLPAEPTLWQLVLAGMVVLWALRLGGYLLVRILATGVDHRFDRMRDKPLVFARFWILQAVTVWVVMLPYALGLSAARAVSPWVWLGCGIWLAGLWLESVSDAVRYRFRRQAENASRPVDAGPWRYSRHPNYFGEMLVWWGIWLALLPAWVDRAGLVLVSALGPVFITGLLLFVSGIPLLEKSSASRYGAAWEAYAARTSLLVPWFPRRDVPTPPIASKRRRR